jgi:Lon protease-like protein
MPKSSALEPARAVGTEPAELPLFPLHDVLFPGGTLPLRIFEARYLDMLARGLRTPQHFGVVLIKEGQETSTVTFHRVGTTATVVDWSQGKDGLLHVRARGQQRFEIVDFERRRDGLYVAQIKMWPADLRVPLPCEYQHMARVVESVLDKLKHHARYLDRDYDDTAWIAYRLAEILALLPDAKQRLLELSDPIARLDQLGSRLEE